MNSTQDTKKDRLIPWYFVLAFVILFVVNGIFLYIAISGHQGTVTENAYQKGLNYNTVIDASERQTKLGWQSTISYKNNQIVVNLTDKNGDFINGATVHVYVTRAVIQGYDFSLPLSQKGTGYVAAATFPLKGQWDIRVVVNKDQSHYQKSQRIFVE